jgi:hypothetical protein
LSKPKLLNFNFVLVSLSFSSKTKILMYQFSLKNNLQTLIIGFLLLFLASCGKPCESSEEPKLEARFASQTPLKFKKIYAKGTPKIAFEAIPSRLLQPPPNSYDELETVILPINLNAKTTTYILESDIRTDSITIAYDLQTNYTAKCGATFILKNMRGVPEKSSFKDIEVRYSPPSSGTDPIIGLPTSSEPSFRMYVRY